MKKTIEELEEIRKKTFAEINLRKGKNGYKVVVGMSTCGISAGARTVMSKIFNEVKKNNLMDITITSTSCLGVCDLEPIVEVTASDGTKATYVKINEDKAARIVEEHLKNDKIVDEFIAAEGQLANPKND